VEVLDMILEEYDEKKVREYLRKEAMEMGREEGLKEGIEQGIEKGIAQMNELTRLLLDAGRLEDLKRVTQDKDFQETLLKEYKLL